MLSIEPARSPSGGPEGTRRSSESWSAAAERLVMGARRLRGATMVPPGVCCRTGASLLALPRVRCGVRPVLTPLPPILLTAPEAVPATPALMPPLLLALLAVPSVLSLSPRWLPLLTFLRKGDAGLGCGRCCEVSGGVLPRLEAFAPRL